VLSKLIGGSRQSAWRVSVGSNVPRLRRSTRGHRRRSARSPAASATSRAGRLPGATIEVTSARRADTQKTVTNGEGDFVVPNLRRNLPAEDHHRRVQDLRKARPWS